MTDAERATKITAELASIAATRRLPLAEVREMWSERAAIREYLGGLRHRRNAELHAVADTFEVFGQSLGSPSAPADARYNTRARSRSAR